MSSLFTLIYTHKSISAKPQPERQIISFTYALLGFQIKRFTPEEEIPVRPKKATLYGIGGQRVELTEHEVAVTQG